MTKDQIHTPLPFPGLALIFLLLLVATPSMASQREVVVDKPSRSLWLIENNRIAHSFPISLGDEPLGHKVMIGDERTPEGSYTLTFKMPDSKFYRSIHIDYPRPEDIIRARDLGVHPGGNIKIHGLPNNDPYGPEVYQGLDWTDGCIAVSNEHMDIVWDFVTPGTPIQILGSPQAPLAQN